MASKPPKKTWMTETAGIAAVLLVVAALYARTASFPSINFDDGRIVFENPVILQGLTWNGCVWSLGHSLYGMWTPVTALTHMLDISLYGNWAGGHHLTSVLWHMTAVLAFYLALRALTGARDMSLVAAALFAVHPLRVEDVAWISSRKDLVCGFFFALALPVHAWYARRPSPLRYSALSVAMLLALAGKTSAAPLPVLLLMLDAWPLGRFGVSGGQAFSPRRALWLVAEKMPLFLMTAVVMLITWRSEQQLGAVVEAGTVPVPERVAAVGDHYLHYLTSFLWPFHLSPHYPRVPLAPWWMAFAWCLVFAVTLVSWLVRRKRPWFTLGWFWFVVMLLPVIGLMQFSSSPYADRFMYLPGMGLSLAAVGAICDAGGQWPRKVPAVAVAAIVLPVLLAMTALTWRQTGYWHDTRAAFTRVIQLYPDDDLAHAKLGICDYAEGNFAGAAAHYREALRIRPDFQEWNYIFGTMLLERDPAKALPYLQKAVSLAPDKGGAQTNLGVALINLNQSAKALPYLEAGARLDPNNPNAHANLGVALLNLGRRQEARAAFQKALALDPKNATALTNMRLVQ